MWRFMEDMGFQNGRHQGTLYCYTHKAKALKLGDSV